MVFTICTGSVCETSRIAMRNITRSRKLTSKMNSINNESMFSQLNVTHTPTIIYHNKQYVGLDALQWIQEQLAKERIECPELDAIIAEATKSSGINWTIVGVSAVAAALGLYMVYKWNSSGVGDVITAADYVSAGFE